MRFEYADGRMPVAMAKAGATYYLTYDQVGSLRVVADSSGTVVKRIDYDSFGNIVGDTNPTFTVPFGFAGGLHDRDTGLIRFGFRDYDPDVGRWLAKDPIGFKGGDVDLFGYCLNDSVNLMDRLGLFNPAKGLSSAVNAFNAARLYRSGMVKLAAAAGLTETGVGAPAGLGSALLGAWNLYSATKAQERALQQWKEALQEDWSDATWRNLLGVLPFGQYFDDPCEPTLQEFFREKYERLTEKKEALWEFISEVGTMGW